MKRRAALLTSLAMTAGVLAVALAYVDLSALRGDLASLKLPLVVLGFGVLGLNYLLRAWRFRLLLGLDRVQAKGLFGIVCLYATLNYLMPARLGEFSLPVLLKQVSGHQYSVGAASLIAARALDLFAVAALFPLALLASHAALPTWVVHAGVVFVVFSGAGVAGLLLYLRGHNPQPQQPHLSRDRLRQRLWAFMTRVTVALSLMARQRSLIGSALLSLGIWLCIAFNFFLILAAAELDVPFIAAFVVTVVMIPLSFVPAQGFANVGSHEAAWLTVLVAMGFAPELAARATLLSHLILLAYVLLMGGIGWTLFMLQRSGAADA